MVLEARFQRKEMPKHQALMAVRELRQCHFHHNLQEGQAWITRDRLFHWCLQSQRSPTIRDGEWSSWRGKVHLGAKICLGLGHRETLPKHPEKLLFIFDGLDESSEVLDLGHNRSLDLCVLPGDVKLVNVIMASLLKQMLLKGSSVLLTSHLATLAKLEMKALDWVATLVGFLARDREQYFHNFFGGVKVAKRVLSYVRDSQVLYALCYNPSYCWITCMALQAYFRPTSPQLCPRPQTITQLLVGYVKHMMDLHGRDFSFSEGVPGSGGDLHHPLMKEFLVQLGSLAGRCLKTRTLVLEEHDLKASRITQSADPSLLTAFVVEDTPTRRSSFQVTYSFLHLGVQEFFAALFHYLDFKEGCFSDMIEVIQEDQRGHYDIFLRFLAGLSHLKTRTPFEELLGSFSMVASERVIDWLEKKNLKALLSATTRSGKRKALDFFNLLFEVQSGHLVRHLMGDSVRMDFSGLYLMPVDCAILGYVLSCCPTENALSDASCKPLGSALAGNTSLASLALCGNPLTDGSFSDLRDLIPRCSLQEI
ncbi:hypothetical protein L345_12092, partial [Ophiophagus hannah]